MYFLVEVLVIKTAYKQRLKGLPLIMWPIKQHTRQGFEQPKHSFNFDEKQAGSPTQHLLIFFCESGNTC